VPDEAFAIANIAPELRTDDARHSPIFRYTYAAASEAVACAPIAPGGSRRVRYMNPLTGGCSMTFVDSHLVQIDPTTATSASRSSSAICCVVEGTGETRVGNETIVWRKKDIFTLPQGNWIKHRTGAGTARLFVVSDRDLMARLGLLNDEYAAGGDGSS
jgi:gentisate 1,2-dioxygenase